MGDVVATLLLRKMTHHACHSSQLQTQEDDEEKIEALADTRLLIIDEILFSGESDIKKIDFNLSNLHQLLNSLHVARIKPDWVGSW